MAWAYPDPLYHKRTYCNSSSASQRVERIVIPPSTTSESMKCIEISRIKHTRYDYPRWEDLAWSIHQAEQILPSHKSNAKQSVQNDKTRNFCTRRRGHPIPASLLPKPCGPCMGSRLLCRQGRSTVDEMLHLCAVNPKNLITSPLIPLTSYSPCSTLPRMYRSFYFFLKKYLFQWIKMDTSPRNRQVNPMGPMGSSSGTGPLEVPGKTSTLFHSCSPIPFVRIAAGAGPNCGQQEVCGARHTRHSSLHTRIWYPLRSGMALESVGFFSPDGLQAKRLRTINKLFSQSEEPAHREASTGEASRKASDLSCTTEGRITL